MADLQNLTFPLTPELDVAKFNQILETMKKSLGMFGKGIKPIDEAEYQATLKRLTDAAQKQIPEAFGKAGKQAQDNFEQALTGGGGNMFARLFNFNQITQAMNSITQAMDMMTKPFIDFEASLKDMSALTGVSGAALDMFGEKAKDLAAKFGGSATGQIEAFKGVLSRLGPDIAKSPEGLERMAVAINTLGKASGLDAKASMEALTTSLLQFNVSLDDPVKAAGEMERMMNVLAAGAKEGAAEIPQVSQAITVAGVAANGAKLSFEETNAAIQLMASGGKYGAEAGTALRNVIGMIQKASGPAEEAMGKMGTSSKELGKILTTQGLGPAVEKLRDGMNKLGTDAERNVALMDIFGTENSAAAGILINKVDQMAGLTAKITGTSTAVAQAKINMDSTQSSIDRFKAAVENQMISLFQSVGGGVVGISQSLSQLLPLMTTLGALKTIFPPGLGANIASMATSLLVKLVPAMFVTTTATGAQTIAFGAMAAAAWAALAPLLPFIAIGAALGVGLYALAGGFKQTTESKIKDAEASEKNIEKQIQQKEAQIATIEGNKKMADSWEDLGKKANKTPEEMKLFNSLQLDLIKAYPGTIDGTKSFAENLVALKARLNESQVKVAEYKKEIDKLSEKKDNVITMKLQLNAEKAVGDAQVEIQKIMQTGFVGVSSMQEGAVLQGMVYNLNKAKDSQELNVALGQIYDKIMGSQNISDADKAKLIDNVENIAKARQSTLDRYAQVREQKEKKLITDTSNEIKAWASKNKIDIFGDMSKEDTAKLKVAIDQITKSHKLTKEEAEKVTAEMEKQWKEANKTSEAVKNIGAKYKDTLAEYQKQRNQGIEKEKDLTLQREVARKAGNTAEVKRLDAEIAKQKEINKQNDKKSDDVDKLGKKVDKQYEEEKKQGKSWLEQQKQELDTQKKRKETEAQQIENTLTYLAISQKRDLTDVENLRIQQAKVGVLEQQKLWMTEIFGITQNADGTIKFAPTVEKKLGKQGMADAEQLFVTIDKDLAAAQKNMIKVKPKMDKKDLEMELLKLQIEEAKATIELGFALPGELETLYMKQIELLNKDASELQKKLDSAKTEEEREQLRVDLAKKRKEIMDVEKVINEDRKKAGEAVLKNLEDQNKKEIDKAQKKSDEMKAIIEQGLDIGAKNTTNKEDSYYNDKLKLLEKQKQNEIITEENYNKEKERVEKEHQARLAALQNIAAGAKLATERNTAVEMLTIKQRAAEKEYQQALAMGDSALAQKKMGELDSITNQLKEKKDLIDTYGVQFQGAITNTFASMFQGDTNALKDSAKQVFQTMAGILKNEASLAITKLVINYLWDPSTNLAWYVKLAAIPAITALISGVVGGIVDPIIGGISSYSTGGRIDSPTFVLAGDASRSRAGADTEWIMRDDQIWLIVAKALADSTETNMKINDYYYNELSTMFVNAAGELKKGFDVMSSIISDKQTADASTIETLLGKVLEIQQKEADFYSNSLSYDQLQSSYQSANDVKKRLSSIFSPAYLNSVMPASDNQSAGSDILNSNIVSQSLESMKGPSNKEVIDAINKSTKAIEELDGRVYVLESDVGQAANRYNRDRIKRSIV